MNQYQLFLVLALLGLSLGKLRDASLDTIFPGFFAALSVVPQGVSGKRLVAAVRGGSASSFLVDCHPVALSGLGGTAWHLVLHSEPERESKTLNADTALSNREIEVMECLLNNLSIKETAGRLGVSENTIKFHVKNLYKKTGIHKRRHIRQVAKIK